MRWRDVLLSMALSAASASAVLAASPPAAPPNFAAPTAAERAAFAACLAKFNNACIGRVRAACAKGDVAETTVGMVACAEKERRLWDERVQSLVALLHKDASPGQIAALDAASAQFEQWRRAKCTYAATLYEGGSMARVLAAEYVMETTAMWSHDLSKRLADERQ